jgi:hypothetical protein
MSLEKTIFPHIHTKAGISTDIRTGCGTHCALPSETLFANGIRGWGGYSPSPPLHCLNHPTVTHPHHFVCLPLPPKLAIKNSYTAIGHCCNPSYLCTVFITITSPARCVSSSVFPFSFDRSLSTDQVRGDVKRMLFEQAALFLVFICDDAGAWGGEGGVIAHSIKGGDKCWNWWHVGGAANDGFQFALFYVVSGINTFQRHFYVDRNVKGDESFKVLIQKHV